MRVGLFARLGIGALLAAIAVAGIITATAGATGNHSKQKLTVTKTAKTSWTRSWTWTVDKKVDPASLDLVDGDSGTVTWSIAAKATRQDSYSVSGTIKVTNPNGSTVSGVTVSDALAGAVVDCDPKTSGAQASGLSIPGKGSITCTYSAAVGSGASGTNVATAAVAGSSSLNGSGSAPYGFSKTPTVVGSEIVDVVDTNGKSWRGVRAADGLDVSYEERLTCPDGAGDHTNKVEVRTLKGAVLAQDEATTVLRCSPRVVPLVVTKTAAASYHRAWNWGVEKSATPASLERQNGQSGSTTWKVDVTRTGPVDTGFAVSGTITVANPNGAAVDGVSVTDSLAGATVDCDASVSGAQATGLTVPGNGSITCTYAASLASKTNGTNTAAATVAGKPDLGGSGSAPYAFGNPSTVTDAVVDVVDTNGRKWENVTGSSSFSYDQKLSCPGDTGTHENTVRVIGDDEAVLDMDTAAVVLKCSETPVPPPPPPPPPPTADVSVTKVDTPDPVRVDEFITYTIRVSNAGPAVATNVLLADPAPTGITLVGATPAKGSCQLPGALVSCQLGSIAAGASVDVKVTARAERTGTVVNRVTVSTETPESNGSNNTAEAQTLVVGKATPPAKPKSKPKPKTKPKTSSATELCKTVGVSTKMVRANGQAQLISVKVTEAGKPKSGVHVLVRGAGIRKTARSGNGGVARITVTPAKGGIVTVSVQNAKRCNTKRIGVVGAFEPPVTG